MWLVASACARVGLQWVVPGSSALGCGRPRRHVPARTGVVRAGELPAAPDAPGLGRGRLA